MSPARQAPLNLLTSTCYSSERSQLRHLSPPQLCCCWCQQGSSGNSSSSRFSFAFDDTLGALVGQELLLLLSIHDCSILSLSLFFSLSFLTTLLLPFLTDLSPAVVFVRLVDRCFCSCEVSFSLFNSVLRLFQAVCLRREMAV